MLSKLLRCFVLLYLMSICRSLLKPVSKRILCGRQSCTLKAIIEKGMVCTITINDLTNMGDGVGRISLPDGKECVVMVPLVIPGEVVSARITKVHSSFCEASLLDVISPSPDRVKPSCQWYTECGGCQYQHLTVDAQRKWKSIQVASALKRIGGFDGIVVNPTVGSINTYGYRSKITPHRQVERSPREIDSTNSPALKVGFQKRKTNQIVDTAHCALATNNVNNAYQLYRSRLTATKPPKISKTPNGIRAQSTQLLFRESQSGTVETDSSKFIETSVGNLTFTYKAGDFFQNNLFVLPMLVDHVIRQVAHPECRHLVDVYCGSGLFALSAAAHFTSVYGVELNADAVNSAQRNAQRNNIINAHFTVGKAESTFQAIAHLPREHTAVVIDPPRNGCDKAFIDQLLVFKPQRIVYVSCDPATQARDAKMLAAGGYKIEDVTPVDLFPQTRHIENVITFVREF